jgi:hypothetical protein
MWGTTCPEGQNWSQGPLSEATPAARCEPVEPPLLNRFVLSAEFGREVGARRRDWRKRLQANGGAKVIHAVRIGDGPGTRESVARIIDALGAETLRTTFVESNAIFEISGVPGGNAALFRADLNKAESGAHEFGFADGMLGNEPSGFGAVRTGEVFGRPTVLGDELAETRGILDMNGFHAGMIGTTEFVDGEELFAEVQVVGTKREEFAAKRLVEHERELPQRNEEGQRSPIQGEWGRLADCQRSRSGPPQKACPTRP